eukprot:m.141673 g.141673  ORF g.141673 m.141673 type:complete len:319 (+) comp10024_c0_seq3:2444-3400(+)
MASAQASSDGSTYKLWQEVLFKRRAWPSDVCGLSEPNHVSALGQVLNDWRVSRLDLRKRNVGVYGAVALASAVPGSRVKSLHLQQNKIESHGAANILAITKQPNSCLTDLDLRDNELGDDVGQVLKECLPKSSLLGLNLGLNGIGDSGAINIAAGLPNSNLTSLDLGNNGIGESGATNLATAMPQSRLTILNLEHNIIADSEAAALAAAMSQSRLISLSLGGNSIGESGAAALVAALPLTFVECFTVEMYNERLTGEIVRSIQSQYWTRRAPLVFGPNAEKTILTALLCAKRCGLHLPLELWQHVFSHLQRKDFDFES